MIRPNDKILFDGDSLTTGLGHSAYARMNHWDRNWADEMMEWLFCQRPELGLTSVKTAVGGSTCRNMIDRYEVRAKSAHATVAIFTIGTNDGITGVPLGDFREQLDAYAQQLLLDGCRLVVHVGGFVPCPNVDEGAIPQLESCSPYWDVGREIMEKRNGLFLDVGPEMKRRAQILVEQWPHHSVYSSGVHYSALGNAIIAGIVLERLGLMALPDVPQ
jgi:lysophospholipase L1-like esterase